MPNTGTCEVGFVGCLDHERVQVWATLAGSAQSRREVVMLVGQVSIGVYHERRWGGKHEELWWDLCDIVCDEIGLDSVARCPYAESRMQP